ncbi:MAG: transketolase C-terminal domain-containing protein [Candidatus Daviesbacteria bacterium]|nr:transketolase C-terminal domain-containing protein [Candidatus Daviesbacteria bacterium]
MRNSFVNSIYKATKINENVLCLVGDIGAFLLRKYIKDFPLNYYNLGAAEANMVGVAAGFAMSGKIPFVYTITPFITSRCYEQIKVDVCYNEANVKLVGIGSGVSYGTMGSTHHSLEDIAIMRALPNMVVISPADPREVEEAVFAAMKHNGPVYIRLTLSSNPLDYKKGKFKIGKARIVKKGSDAAIIATGDMVRIANEASVILKKNNINCYVINIHTIKPIDEELIKKLSRECKAIVSIEEHSIIGGLGSAVSSIISQYSLNKARYKIMGFNDIFCKEYSKDKLKIFEKYGLSTKHLVKTMFSLYNS